MKIFLLFLMAGISSSVAVSLAKPGCPGSCGEVAIPYPFGIGSGCYMNKWFSITCDKAFNHQRPFLSAYEVEVFNISLEQGTVDIYSPTTEYINGSSIAIGKSLNLGDSPYFWYSATKNVFAAFGCGLVVTISQDNQTVAGCLSICSDLPGPATGCAGLGCCQTAIPLGLKNYNVTIIEEGNLLSSFPISLAFVVKKRWVKDPLKSFKSLIHRNANKVPVVLDWNIFVNETPCQKPNCSKLSFDCPIQNDGFAQCACAKGYQGNPYLGQGCQDVDECLNPAENHCIDTCYGDGNEIDCIKTCKNVPGSYYCSCPPGYHGDAYIYGSGCSIIKSESHIKAIFLGTATGILLFCLFMGTWWLFQLTKRAKKTKMKEFYFKRNGGLLLQQQICTMSGGLAKFKLFTLEELEIASDHFNESRILGRGGQSTVYKGMLTDGRIIAIKRFKSPNGQQAKQFINEVLILSQINHRNVVKSLGCCLETETPFLVYEFIPNGTLWDLIHNQIEEKDCSVSWFIRLRIATETARAIFYLHSAASFPIYHGDIKSTNILLDDKYRAKLSDFGTSRSIPYEQTDLTTQVKGTFGYLDPEYFRSGRLTGKSDVYSFGVVLVELLTGQKPISTLGLEEGISLVDHFLLSIEENQLLGILDPQVAKEEKKEQVMAMVDLARKCLNMIGKHRPSIQEVATELEGISLLNQALTTQENIKHVKNY